MAVAGAAAEALASSCTSSPDCISLGYKYTLSDCPNGGVKCPFDTSKYFCFSPESACTYAFTADYCSSQCKNAGTTSCKKNGTTYYASCGSSKCTSGQECNNGICETPAPSCTYQYTFNDCFKLCKRPGSKSCERYGETYYAACENYQCSSGQTCEAGYCKGGCNYAYTASDCAKACKNPGSVSCTQNNTTLYESCGSSYCTSGQTCNGYGKCESGGSSGGGDESNPAPGECTYTVTADECAAQCKDVEGSGCVRDGVTYYFDCSYHSKCQNNETCINGVCTISCCDDTTDFLGGCYYHCTNACMTEGPGKSCLSEKQACEARKKTFSCGTCRLTTVGNGYNWLECTCS